MSAMIEAGYLVVELEKFQVAFNEALEEPPTFRVDLEIVEDEGAGLVWSSTSEKTSSTSEMVAFLEPSVEANAKDEEEENEEDRATRFAGSVCTVGCNHFQRTEFIDMTDDIVSKFMNSSLKLDVVSIGKPVEVKKGPPERSMTAVATLFYPLSCLVKGNQTFLEISTSLEETKQIEPKCQLDSSINGALSSAILRLSLDNGFAEYIAGGNVMQWNSASLKNIPLDWCVPLVDGNAGKKGGGGKKGAVVSEEDMRQSSLAKIETALSSQENSAIYSMNITLEDDNSSDNLSAMNLVLGSGRLSFDVEGSADIAVSEEQQLENNPSLWSISWGCSSFAFIHRSNVKKLSSRIVEGDLFYSANVTKSQPSGSTPDDLTAVGKMDASALNVPHEKTFSIGCAMLGCGLEEVSSECLASVSFQSPVAVANAFEDSNILPVDVVSLKNVSHGGAGSRDVKKELRNEIADIVKEIAQEYVGLYPHPPAQPLTSQAGVAVAAPGLEDVSIEARKSHFMHYLSTHGTYHRFKEALKPRIQRYARERYGARNRAMGKAGSHVDSAGYSEKEEVPLDDMISELYVLLTQECNAVLNSMYKSTIIDRDMQELEKMPLIDDEVETPKQKFLRLHKLASDAAADLNHSRAEQFHLERIQLAKYEVSLKSDTLAPHHAFFEYFDYLIRRSASLLLAFRNSSLFSTLPESEKHVLPENVETLRDEARQALKAADAVRGQDWMTMMQMGLILLEGDQLERAGELLLSSVRSQLHLEKKENATSLSLDDFQGYESDDLCPVHPLAYVSLSLFYTKMEMPLSSRKCVRMAVKSFGEGDFHPPVKEHGKPKKTAVLCMAQTAIFLYERGLTGLADMCVQFAKDCDEAVSRKAKERNMAFDTVPAITHLMKQAQALQCMYSGRSRDAMSILEESIAISKTVEHKVDACMAAVKAAEFAYPDNFMAEKRRLYNQALDYINCEEEEARDYEFIPLAGYVDLGKLLIQQNCFAEALNAMLYGCAVYPSATLFNLVGICCLRLERLQDAEDSLQEANLIDNRNPNVWAYLCVLCLYGGSQRMAEAEKSLQQALRLGLADASVLREMATAYIAVDKLQTAESLIRRALAIDIEMGKNNPHTRRLLGDVLAGQNQAAQAVDEYQAVIEDDGADIEARILAGEKCSQLLQSLGRTEERRTLDEIIETLHCD